jgi:hypothetical protein
MTTADITALRAQACEIVAALGAVCDKLAIVAETLRNPSQTAPDIDVLVISEHLSAAAGSAERLAAEASDFAQALDQKQHQEDAPCKITSS